jgi:raffinose/stachyose/melibiose transport system permease protein
VTKLEKRTYTYLFLIPTAVFYGVFFILPTIMSFFFSLTHWTLTDWEFIGLENFKTFLSEPSMRIGIKNTIIYAFLTSGFKVLIGFFLGLILSKKMKLQNYFRTVIFFPNLVSAISVGIMFCSLMHPTKGLINVALGYLGITGPNWLGNASLALYSVIMVDVWKGLGVATLIYIAGMTAISTDYYEAADIDGATEWDKIKYITFPLTRGSMNTVITLSFVGGLKSFDLIYAMTKGGPGFATDVIGSIVYKQYAAGFFGLSVAGNVLLFIVVAVLAFPLYMYITSKEVEL